MAPISTPDIQRILVTRLRYLGDVVLSTPLVRALRQAFPKVRLAYLCEKPYSEVLEHNPHLDEIIPLERKEIASLPLTRQAFAHASFIKRLREGNFDLVIDLLGNPRSGLLSFLTGAKYRLGPARHGRRAYYTHLVPEPDGLHHQIESHLEFLRPLGLYPSEADPRTELFVSEDEKDEVRSYLADNRLSSHPLIVIHPGASWPAKRWLPERFAQAAEQLRKELKATFILLSGPNEQAVIREVIGKTKDRPFVAEGLTIRTLCALLSACDLFITNDAGPMHIACALGRPTIALFGPGDPQTWFPYKQENQQAAIHHPPSCWPCHLDECDRLDCMRKITVGEVVEEAKQFLSPRPAPSILHPGILCPT